MELPVVLVIGLESIPSDHQLSSLFRIYCLRNDTAVGVAIIQYQPAVIITIGPKWDAFSKMCQQSASIKSRWIHKERLDDVSIDHVYRCILTCSRRSTISIVTVMPPSWKTEDVMETYRSLFLQTISSWEWIIVTSDNQGVIPNDKRIQHIHTKRGFDYRFHQAFSLADGPFIWCLPVGTKVPSDFLQKIPDKDGSLGSIYMIPGTTIFGLTKYTYRQTGPFHPHLDTTGEEWLLRAIRDNFTLQHANIEVTSAKIDEHTNKLIRSRYLPEGLLLQAITKKRQEGLISVIIPTYKRIDLLRRAIESVRKQTANNWELCIIGDRCPYLDNFMKSLQEETPDPRIKWCNLETNHRDSGTTPRNYGLIYVSSGAIIAYLDDDNVWKEDHLESLYKGLTQSKAMYAFSSFTMVNPDGKQFPIICKEPKLYRIDTSALMHRYELVTRYGLWSYQNKLAHDWELVSRWSSEKWYSSQKLTLVYHADPIHVRAHLVHGCYSDQDPLQPSDKRGIQSS